MKTTARSCLMLLASLLCWQAEAQIYDTNNVVVNTFAGSAFTGHLDGQTTDVPVLAYRASCDA